VAVVVVSYVVTIKGEEITLMCSMAMLIMLGISLNFVDMKPIGWLMLLLEAR
jgi:hypothetical protein